MKKVQANEFKIFGKFMKIVLEVFALLENGLKHLKQVFFTI